MTAQELEAYDAMMADRDRWKAAHDYQVELKRIISASQYLKERAPMVEKLMAERNRAQGWSTLQHDRIKKLEKAGIEIIEAARRSLPRPHPTIERNAKLFIPGENAERNAATQTINDMESKPDTQTTAQSSSASPTCSTLDEALLALGGIQSVIAEVFEMDRTPITPEEVRAVCERNAGSGIHSCHPRCMRPACVARRELETLRDAVRAYRDAKGRYHTQKACERLISLLPENAKAHAPAVNDSDPT